jgi:hypothetical protein
MTTQQFLKGLLMALVAIFVTAWTTPPIEWVLVGISAVTAILTYFGKNLIPWLHSDSVPGQLSLINLGSGVLVALGTGLLNLAGQYFIEGVILWPVVLKLVVSITFTYLGATLFSGPYTTKKVALFK